MIGHYDEQTVDYDLNKPGVERYLPSSIANSLRRLGFLDEDPAARCKRDLREGAQRYFGINDGGQDPDKPNKAKDPFVAMLGLDGLKIQ